MRRRELMGKSKPTIKAWITDTQDGSFKLYVKGDFKQSDVQVSVASPWANLYDGYYAYDIATMIGSSYVCIRYMLNGLNSFYKVKSEPDPEYCCEAFGSSYVMEDLDGVLPSTSGGYQYVTFIISLKSDSTIKTQLTQRLYFLGG